MTELSRNLLAAAREGLAPDPAVAARVRARVAAAVGATTAVAPVKASATAGAVKIGGALLALGLIVGALTVLPRSPERTQVPQLSATTIEDEPTPRGHEVAVASQSAVLASAVAEAPPARQPVATLAREVELIDRAMLALRRGAAAAALEAIAMFDRETRGQGQMAEDAAAVAIEAHCTLRHDVAARLAAFDRAYPSSAQRARLRDACR